MLARQAGPAAIYRAKSRIIVAAVFGPFGAAVGVVFLVQAPRHASIVGLVLGLCFLYFGTVVAVRLALSGVTETHDGVRVINVFSRYRLDWDDIVRFELHAWGPLPSACVIHLTDQSRKIATGIAERNAFADGSAQAMVDELNRSLREHLIETGHGPKSVDSDNPGQAQSELFEPGR